MLENAKNPDNTVMGLLCLTVSLLGSQLNCISQILCASEPFHSTLALVNLYTPAHNLITSLSCMTHLQVGKPPEIT